MDGESYRAFVLGIKDRVFGYSARLLRDAEEAQDVTQEALVRLWEQREAIPDAARARSWVFRTAHNLAHDRLRTRNRRPGVGAGVLGALPSDAPDPERQATSRQALRQLEVALSRLQPADRAVVLMREAHALPYEEMAEILELPVGTVKARVHRARTKLRQLLRDAGVTL
jgi:RNA polymerase sigma-70 factor (ECF subfamily)